METLLDGEAFHHPYGPKEPQVEVFAKKRNEKLSPRFYGPYQIIKQIGPMAFELDLPPESKTHLVFHVSLLNKALAPTSNRQPLPPMIYEDLELQVSPTADLPEFEATWEPVEVIKKQFPSFHLEDKTLWGVDWYLFSHMLQVGIEMIRRGAQLKREKQEDLTKPVTKIEIWKALQDIGDNKYPGIDGFNANFFKKSWSMIKGDAIHAVMELFNHNKMYAITNYALVTLIPKTKEEKL
ncbi:hypothetical protein KIW84_057131 [Lathyrus oleraceus]|uniref:Tf2-1-like SH3-like domain-containing protein n=1 Tax=Pisum sativum TaxID=3888 RepID=A0A9D4X3D2_PEA|nr:hypothetical protein KIW84_057131 [Pisum sativum]